MIGKTLAHYKILSLIGRGGMGEVYRAKDLKLGRDVAIKVLPEEFAQDAERVARFQREAKLLASLNHPNIAAIHGLEESGGTHFLVLELVEGVTLEDYIAGNAGVSAGKNSAETAALPELLKLALQITEALEAAHEKGVIHRDLKPANIKITPDDKVKILDFGLAKAFAGDQQEIILSDSPTLSITATEKGVILGTAAYMSPEQARGKAVDKRTDIWAFGCVLYEMLTGQAAFQGEDVGEILASVIKADNNLDLLPADIHWRVREVLNRCLQKDLKKRYRDIGDVHFELEQVLVDPSGVFVQPVPTAKSEKKPRLVIPGMAACFVLGLIIAGVAVWMLKPTEPKRVLRFSYDLPEGQEFDLSQYSSGHPLAVSPDGRQFIYSTRQGLYLHSEDELEASLIPGTGDDDPQSPFFSPDGQFVGYWSRADGKLKKIAVRGGASVALCDVKWVYGAIWYADNTIMYAEVQSGIMRVSANGGTPEMLFEANGGSPQLLPDGKSVLFMDTSRELYKIVVHSLESGERKELFEGTVPSYLPTGHLVYGCEGGLCAVPFNPNTLEVEGGQALLVEGAGNPSLSDSGTLVYIPFRDSAEFQPTLVWVDREGEEEPLPFPARFYSSPSISPDGSRVVSSVFANGNSDIWVQDINRGGNGIRLTTDEAADGYPLWTPDGRRILFSSSREGASPIYWTSADGTGEAEPLPISYTGMLPYAAYSWADEGKILIMITFSGNRNMGVGEFWMEGDHELKPLLQEDYSESYPQISPDGRWLAYTSNESGREEIYVRPFPEVDKRLWQVSIDGGRHPRWSPDGRELFFESVGSETGAIMAVAVKTEPEFSPGMPEELFKTDSFDMGYLNHWDVSPNGNRFLMIKRPETTDEESPSGLPRKINIVLNWFEELNQQVPLD